MDTQPEKIIAELEDHLRQAMLASDIGVLDELLAEDLVFTNHLGQRLSKEADLSAHRSGALFISQLEPSELLIRSISASVAIVSVRVQIAGKYAGQPAGGDLRFTRVWVQSPDGRWQVVAAHASAIA